MNRDHSFVVTGGAQGVGAAIVTELARDAHVVVIDIAAPEATLPDGVLLSNGDARDPEVCARAAADAEALAPLTGWVNNAAIFQDAAMTTTDATEVLEMITANLAFAVSGCHAAINHFLRHHRAGAVVNVSSHQAQRPVRGALPYATAKAALEGLTRAAAVDHGPHSIRVNAVSLGSIATARYHGYRAAHPDADAQMAAIHPLGRVGTPEEVARAVAFLLSDSATFINGVVLPVDGGRAAQGPDPESA